MPRSKDPLSYDPQLKQALDFVLENGEIKFPMQSEKVAQKTRFAFYSLINAMRRADEDYARKHPSSLETPWGSHRYSQAELRIINEYVEHPEQPGSYILCCFLHIRRRDLDPTLSIISETLRLHGVEPESYFAPPEQDEEEETPPAPGKGDPFYSEIAARARQESEGIDVAAMIRSLGASRDESETPPKAATTPLAGDPPEAASVATYCPHPSWEYNHLIDARVCSRCGKPEPASPASPRPEAGN